MYIYIWQLPICFLTLSCPLSVSARLMCSCVACHMRRFVCVSCADFGMCHVKISTCLMCRYWSVLCGGFSQCHVQLQSRTSSLRSEHASPRSVGQKQQGTAHDQSPALKQIRILIYIHDHSRRHICFIYINIYIYINM